MKESNFIEIVLNEDELKKMYNEKLEQHIKKMDTDRFLWDMKELCRQICMSENTIKDKFFYDPRFPKYKIGGKWYMPVEKTKKFLLEWLEEQPQS